MAQNILLPPSIPLVDSNGLMTREWFLFFQQLFLAQGGNDTPGNTTDVFVQEAADVLPDAMPAAQPLQAITVDASPFVYQALFDGLVIVQQNTVTAAATLIELSRDGTNFYPIGQNAGQFALCRLDTMRVTYQAAPTMYFART